MSAADNMAVIARLEQLLKSVEAGIADMADPERTKGIERMLGALESGVADIVQALSEQRIADAISAIKMPNVEITPTFNVPRQELPAINVSVDAIIPQAPPPIIHVMPAAEQKPARFKVTIPGQFGGPDRCFIIEREIS